MGVVTSQPVEASFASSKCGRFVIAPATSAALRLLGVDHRGSPSRLVIAGGGRGSTGPQPGRRPQGPAAVERAAAIATPARPNRIYVRHVLPGPDPHAAAPLGEARLHHRPAVRSRGRRRHHGPVHLPARARPRAVERGLRAALAPPRRRPLRREPEPALPAPPVPGDPQAGAEERAGALPRVAQGRSASTRSRTTSASSRTTGSRPPSAPGASAGRSGATAWRSPSSPTSSSAAASTASRSRPSSPTGSSASHVPAERGERLRHRVGQGREVPRGLPRQRGGDVASTPSTSPTRTLLFALFDSYEKECKRLITECQLPLPAYDYALKCSHTFNLLDARGAISVTERADYIKRVRDNARLCAEGYLRMREKLGYPLLQDGVDGGRAAAAARGQAGQRVLEDGHLPAEAKEGGGPCADFLLELGAEELPGALHRARPSTTSQRVFTESASTPRA